MITRRRLIPRLALLGAGGAVAWLMRDRIPWPPLQVSFAEGHATPWIPLPRGARLIEIPAAVDGSPIRAVVDSGAQFSAIDRGVAQRLRLPQTIALPLMAYGVSGEPDLTYTVKLRLGLPGLAVQSLRPAALDIRPLSAVTGRDFHMLIGRDVLREVVVDADFPGDRVRFVARGAYRPARDALTLPLTNSRAGPVTPVRIEGAAPVDVMVDTGATGALALSAEAARETGLLAPGRRVDQAHSVSLGGLSLDRVVTAEMVAVGPLSFRNVPTQIYAPSQRGPVPAGLLGAGLLGRFRVGLDLAGQRLFLTPATPLVITPQPGGN